MMDDHRLAGVPSQHLLSAALHVSECFSTAPQHAAAVRQTMHHLPSDGIYTPTHLHAGEEILVAAGVVARATGKVVLSAPVPPSPELLLIRYLEHSPPPWLGAATKDGHLDPAFVPDVDGRILSDLLGDPERRDALLLAMGQRFDDEHRKRIGLEGEEAVVQACQALLTDADRPDLAIDVLHASLISDQLGYDVRTPTLSGATRRLEVKTDPGSSAKAHFFLSRNEFRVGRADPDWSLVVCRRDDGAFHPHGWVDADGLSAHVPSDQGSGSWSSVEIALPLAELQPGLPHALA